MSRMHYIDTPKAQPQQQGGAEKYHGDVAAGYDAKRESDPKWTVEQKVITGMLADLPAGTVVLDCPVGTGRFIPFYVEKGFQFIGADLSGDMLVQSALKLLPQAQVERWVQSCNQANQIIPMRIKDKGVLLIGDVREIGMEDKSADVAVACRITRWLSPDDCKKMMRQLQRVARKRIIITARVANHPQARSLELFESALDGWKVAQNQAGAVTDYRILSFEPSA